MASDIATVVAAVAIVAFIGWRFVAPPVIPLNVTPPNLAVGTSLDEETLGVDFASRPQTLIMALASDCGYCQESMPFYRRLLARERDSVQIVVAAPVQDIGIVDYLASENVLPDAVVFTDPGSGTLPVPGTPTLLVVDSEGVVTYSWIGLLNAEREADVLGVLFDSSTS